MTATACIAVAKPADPEQEFLSRPTQLVLVLALAVVARAIYWNLRPPDMSLFLEPWFAHIVHYGPIGAFAHPFSNYEPAYLYVLALGSLAHGLLAPMTIIKILSVLGTLFLTLALGDLLKAAGAERRSALLLLLLPSVVINDALLGQCDALWAGSCLFALAAMMRGHSLRSLVWCGVAVAFKAQAAFIAPVIAGALIGRRAPWWHWSIPPLVFLASLVPPWLLGWPGIKLLTVYLDQASLDQIAGRLGNPWMAFTVAGVEQPVNWFMLGYAAAGAAAVAIAALAARSCRDPRLLLVLGALSATALPFLLPKMLERYYFLGDVLTLALALSFRNRNATCAALAVQAASALSLMTYLYSYDHPWPALVAGVAAGGGLLSMCRLLPSLRPVLALPLPAWAGRTAA
jgi:hypothetical protein